MTALNAVVVTMILGSALLLAFVFYQRRSWVLLSIVGAFLIRAAVVFIISGDLQYVFVIDSLGYEQKAWYLLQPSMTSGSLVTFGGNVNSYNYYDYVLSFLFDWFGNHSIIAPLVNSLFATLTILFLYLIQRDLLSKSDDQTTRYRALGTVILAALYPSYIVWSATNIRDPLYFLSSAAFLYFALKSFSQTPGFQFPARVAGVLAAGFSFWMILGLRGYILPVFGVSGVAAIFFHTIRRFLSVKAAILTLISLVLIAAYSFQFAVPDQAETLFGKLTVMRNNFSNAAFANLYAQSSFGIDQTFSSVTDVLLFLPNAVGHYFLGPFPWEVRGLVQSLSLFEAAVVYVCVVPTFRGIAGAYRRAPFQTTVLVSFILILSVSQALVIGNMGTIYRHRTLSLLLLLVFTGEGLYEFAKKNRPALLAA